LSVWNCSPGARTATCSRRSAVALCTRSATVSLRSVALELLDAGVMAWLQHPPRRGRPNAGVVVDPDGATVVDTLMTPSQYEPVGAARDDLRLRGRRGVLTGSSVEPV